jgi:hypothetical protein
LVIGGAVVVLIAAIAATAAITYAVARNMNAPNATPPNATPTPAQPQFSAADQAAAKQQVCHIFDVSVRGSTGQGGMRQNGQLNVPVMLRAVNSAVAVQNSLNPAVPEDVAKAAHRYIDATLEMTAAAAGNPSNDDVNRLTDVANGATDALVEACGLPH